jgi:hypothetical protein
MLKFGGKLWARPGYGFNIFFNTFLRLAKHTLFMKPYLIIPLSSTNQKMRIEPIDITAENQNTLLKTDYPECLLLDLNFVTALSQSKAAKTAVAEQLAIPLQTLCAKHQHALQSTLVQDMGDAGVGAFLKAYATLDPEQDCFIYSGLYLRYDKIRSKQSDKGMQLQIEEEKILITAEGQRAGLLQHLPEAHTIPDDLTEETVAAENLFQHTYFVYVDSKTVPELTTPLCFPLRCLIPRTCITAHRTPLLLGFNYSPSYWAARKRAPLFFHQDGTPLVQQPYLFLLQTAQHKITLAYATEQAVTELCAQKYFYDKDTLIPFESINLLDKENRFLAVNTTSLEIEK